MPPPLYPLRFRPYLRPMPWGGHNLRNWVQAPWPSAGGIGEAWLLSDHPVHSSVVENGPLAGCSLRQLTAERAADLLGWPAQRFPLIIKLLDARENLSVQVHPDDEQARQLAPGEGGKSEAWLVLAAEPTAVLHLGLKAGLDLHAVARELQSGNLPLCLRQEQPRPGDCFSVPAGTIHALGGGVQVLEVQQTSDATFRLFDWGRRGADGQPRPLHLEQGLACLKERPEGAGRCSPRQVAAGRQELLRTPFFTLERFSAATNPVSLAGPLLLVSLSGCPTVAGEPLQPGQLLFLPAAGPPAPLLLREGDELASITIPDSR